MKKLIGALLSIILLNNLQGAEKQDPQKSEEEQRKEDYATLEALLQKIGEQEKQDAQDSQQQTELDPKAIMSPPELVPERYPRPKSPSEVGDGTGESAWERTFEDGYNRDGEDNN